MVAPFEATCSNPKIEISVVLRSRRLELARTGRSLPDANIVRCRRISVDRWRITVHMESDIRVSNKPPKLGKEQSFCGTSSEVLLLAAVLRDVAPGSGPPPPPIGRAGCGPSRGSGGYVLSHVAVLTVSVAPSAFRWR